MRVYQRDVSFIRMIFLGTLIKSWCVDDWLKLIGGVNNNVRMILYNINRIRQFHWRIFDAFSRESKCIDRECVSVYSTILSIPLTPSKILILFKGSILLMGEPREEGTGPAGPHSVNPPASDSRVPNRLFCKRWLRSVECWAMLPKTIIRWFIIMNQVFSIIDH